LPDAELEELIAGDTSAALAAEGSIRGALLGPGGRLEGGEEAARAILDACLSAVGQLDAAALELELERASVALSRAHLLDRLLTPLMVRIGDLWQEGTLRPVHEHLTSAIVRSFIGGLRSGFETSDGAPRMLVTTPLRQRHELGALMAAATAASEGWRAIYLGPDLPVEEIAAGARESGAQVVGLSIVYPPDDPALPGEMLKLRRLLGDPVTLLFGGRAAAGYLGAFDRVEGRVVEDLSELREILSDLRSPT
ncbi:MAG: cobalamin-dependent protein, partial [Acidobacteriota bacterium]